MKFVVTTSYHIKAESLEHVRAKIERINDAINDQDANICSTGFSEEKEEDGESGKSDH